MGVGDSMPGDDPREQAAAEFARTQAANSQTEASPTEEKKGWTEIDEVFSRLNYCIGIGNVKTAGEILGEANTKGLEIDQARVQTLLQDKIDSGRRSVEKMRQELDEDIELSKTTRGVFDSFEHGSGAPRSVRERSIEYEKERVQKIVDFAKEQSITVN